MLNDPSRIAALEATALLDSKAEPAFDRLTRLATAVLNVPVALVSLVDDHRQFFKSAQGLPEPWCTLRETPLTHSFCQHVVVRRIPLVIDDASTHRLVRDNLAISELGVRAYAGIPLVTEDGHVLGSFCAIDTRPREWSAADIAVLTDLASSVMSEIRLRMLARESEALTRAMEIRSQERLALLDAVTDGLYGLDSSGRCHFINRAGAELIGYTPQEVVGRDMHALMHHSRPDGTPYPESECPFAKARAEGLTVTEIIETFWRRDGSSFMALCSSRPVTLRGEASGVLVSFADVSARLRAERRTAMQHAVSRVLVDAVGIEPAIPSLLAAIGEVLDWQVALFWEPDASDRLKLRTSRTTPERAPAGFIEASRACAFERGQGLGGRVWKSGRAEWLETLGDASTFMRSDAAAGEGLRAGVAFPVKGGRDVLGVVELFSYGEQRLDPELLVALETVGHQIGQFFERKRAEAALSLANRAIAASSVGVTISDARGEDRPIVYVNPGFTAITGYEAGETLGRNCRFLQGAQTDPESLEAIRTALRTRTECRVVLLNYRKTGEAFWNELTISPVVDEAGELTHFVGIQNDVTEEKHAQEAIRERDYLLQAIFTSISAQVAVLDRHGVIAYVSESWARFAEENAREPASVGVGANYLTVCRRAAARSEHAREALEGVQAVMAHRLPRFSMEYPCHSPTEERWFEMHVDAMPSAHGGAVITHLNTTERRRGEDALREAKLAAEAANRAKSQFLANMSHELRTPINAVILYSELLQEECEDLGVSQFIPDLGKINAAARHLLGLINNVLDLSKIEAGRMELYLETFDIERIVKDVADTIEPLVDKNRNSLHVDCPADIGTMHADVMKLRQSLFNLLSNAAKFTHNGRISLQVRREADSGAESCIAFEVTDDGIGMSAEQIAELFQPFAQADASTTRKYGGTGLGLDISRRFCRAMGGDISVRSAPGSGSTFRITLPAEASAAAAAPVPLAAPGVDSARALALVVDDESAARDLLSRLLNREGFDVITAADGEAALRMATEFKPALITVDITMPGMDGWTLMARLKAVPELRDVPIIVVSLTDDRRLGFAMGAADFIVKPIDRKRLSVMLQRFRSPGRRATVLIVDDEQAFLDTLSEALRAEGWNVVTATDGETALAALSDLGTVDILLLDLVMPGMDGFEFLERVRAVERWAELPVVVITAADLTAAQRTRLSGSIQEMVHKSPRGPERLLAEVRRVVQTRASRKAP